MLSLSSTIKAPARCKEISDAGRQLVSVYRSNIVFTLNKYPPSFCRVPFPPRTLKEDLKKEETLILEARLKQARSKTSVRGNLLKGTTRKLGFTRMRTC